MLAHFITGTLQTHTSNVSQADVAIFAYLESVQTRDAKRTFFLMKRIHPLWRQAQLMQLRLCTSLQGECLESNIHTTYKQTELYLYIQQITQSLKNVNNSKR